MHDLNIFEQGQKGLRSTGRLARDFQLGNECMLSGYVPFALPDVPFCHADIIGERHWQKLRRILNVPLQSSSRQPSTAGHASVRLEHSS